MSKLTNEEFLQKLKDNNIKYIPLEEYKGSHIKIKWMCYENNKHIFEAKPCDIFAKKCSCPYCNHRIVFVGETDMWTTRPDIASMLLNPDDGYKYFANGSQKLDWICPCCGTIVKDKIINNVTRYGLSCPICSDGMSFGEKFIYELFTQLKCEFIHDKTTDWSGEKRYDFYIPSISLIVEVHGLQHYEKSFRKYSNNGKRSRTLEEEKENDAYKKELALSNNIKYYIQLDCRKSDFNYIKKSILNSELNNLFDLSIIDWSKCYKATTTSNVIICSDLWNNGMKNTREISDYTGIHICSVISNLKKASEIGLCNYVKNYNKNKKRYKKVLCVETGKIYEYINEVKKDGYNESHVSNCCNNKCETAYGLHWEFI